MANVITNMQMERLAAANGPTGGQILRPSDQQAAKRVAFVQCAGSRDENHLPYCSYICCMASLKQVTYLREKDPEAEAYIFYIDLRTPGRYEQFFWKVRDNEKVKLIRGKVAKVTQEPGTDNVVVVAEDTAVGDKVKHDLRHGGPGRGHGALHQGLPLPPAALLYAGRLHHSGTLAAGNLRRGYFEGPPGCDQIDAGRHRGRP